MCVLTMPGITYFPVASMTASACGQPSRELSPMRAIKPSSSRMSVGPCGGVAGPGMTMAWVRRSRFTGFAWTGAFAPPAAGA